MFGRGKGLPCSSKLRKSARRPFSSVVDPSSFSRWKPETKSYTSFEVLSLEILLGLLVLSLWFLAVAVVGLIVQDEDALHSHEVWHDALEHLPFGLECVRTRSDTSLEQGAPAFREVDALAPHEGVVVGDDDPRLLDVVAHVIRHQLAAEVVVVGVIRLEYAEPILDRDARRDDEEAIREVLARGPAHRVYGLPSNQSSYRRRWRA